MSEIDGQNLSGVSETLLITLYIHANGIPAPGGTDEGRQGRGAGIADEL